MRSGLALLAVALAVSTVLVSAQNPTMLGHPEDYPRVDVEHGARVYAEHCDRCHGRDGNGVGGVDLRSGKFRNATTDNQLRTVITNGFPTAGMPAFKLDSADLTGLVAYLRNMNSIDRGSLRAGDAAHGKVIVETKGACLTCHRINGQGARKAPNLSDIGANRSAGSLERSLRRSVEPDVADQPPRPHRDERRTGDQRPARERGQLHGADLRRGWPAALADQGRSARIHRIHQVDDAVLRRKS